MPEKRKRGRHQTFESEKKNMNVTLTGNERIMKDGSTLVSMTDLTGKITYANRDFSEIVGIEQKDLLNKPHSIIRHPAVPRSAFQDLWDTIQDGLPWNGLVVNRAATGDHYWVDANVAPRTENGQVTGYISVRRKPSREAVAAAGPVYQAILEGRLPFPWSDTRRLTLKARFYLLACTLPAAWIAGTAISAVIPFAYGLLVKALLYSVPAVLAAFLMRSVLASIRHSVQAGNQMAAGDLTVSIPHNRNDEIGTVQKSMLSSLINTAGTVGMIKDSLYSLKAASKNVAAASQSLSAGMVQSSSQSQAIAASASQMNRNLEVISSSAEEMSISVGEVAKKAAEAAAIAADANRTAAETDAIVRDLGQGAGQIGEVIETIGAIAAQTNLLALNAAIEAAGAGQAGRGFAVVAQEVKELARQSARASEDIKRQVQGIQQGAENSVDAIKAIAQIVGRISAINSSIASAVEEQSITTKEIAANVHNSSAASREVAKSVEGISSASLLGERDAAAMAKMAAELDSIASDLDHVASQFKV